MSEITLRNGVTVEIQSYCEDHAVSIAFHLFQRVDKKTIMEQRESLLAPGPDEVYSVCCISNSEVVGVCTGVRKPWYGERHRIEYVQVVVRDDFRGLGVAKNMMKDIARHFKTRGIETLQISVQAENKGALHAYQKIGFEKFGLLKGGLKHDGEYSDEIFLSMPVSRLLRE